MIPEVKYVLIVCADDTVAVMQFVTKVTTATGVLEREATPAEITTEIEKAAMVWPREKLPVRTWRMIDPSDLPTDRAFRSAWRQSGSKLTIDMPAAVSIQRDRLRAARVPLLAELDIAYQMADEAGDQTEKRKIAKRKQALRDAPSDPLLEEAETPEELAAITIDDLIGE